MSFNKKLGKFTYNVIENHNRITPYLLKWIIKEWKQDIEEFPDQPWSKEWIELVHTMEFSLVQLELEIIRLRQDLMEYDNGSYNFSEHLKERATEMEESILRGSSIKPLLVNGENMELMDGYTRYTILKKHKQKLVYVYLGKTEDKKH